jgi:recombination protein RecA
VAIFINQLRMKVGVMYGNPEVTAGGNALKYYASVRLDVRRVETLKAGGEPIGSHTRVRVVKNKVAPPFKEAEFDVMYGKGISRMGELLDLAIKLEIIQKSGSWFSYKEERLGQGRDKVKELLLAQPALSEEIEQLVMDAIQNGNVEADEAPAAPMVEIPIAAAAQYTASHARSSIDISVDDE